MSVAIVTVVFTLLGGAGGAWITYWQARRPAEEARVESRHDLRTAYANLKELGTALAEVEVAARGLVRVLVATEGKRGAVRRKAANKAGVS